MIAALASLLFPHALYQHLSTNDIHALVSLHSANGWIICKLLLKFL